MVACAWAKAESLLELELGTSDLDGEGDVLRCISAE